MKGERQLNRDLNRLAAASAMLAAQQWERAWLGDDDAREDVLKDTRGIVSEVLTRIEQALDEDLVEQLDRVHNPALGPFALARAPFTMPSPFSFLQLGGGLSGIGGKHGRLDRALEDFRISFEAQHRRAKRQDHTLSAADLDLLLQQLKEDLQDVLKKSKRKDSEAKA